MLEKCLHTSPEIIREIKEKLAELAEYEVSPSCIAQKVLEYTEIEAAVHSEKIEKEEEMRHIKRKGNGLWGRKKEISKHIEEAIRFANTVLFNNGFEAINGYFIRAIAFNVCPKYFIDNKEFTLDKNSGLYLANFRELLDTVRVSSSRFTQPYGEKVPIKMQKFIEKLSWLLSQDKLEHIIEGAFFAHLHLVRIHPFGDCNGRTARILQNAILKSKGLPPPIIYSGERQDYYGHIEEAMLDWRNRTGLGEDSSNGEHSFYNYLAGKLSATLDSILDSIKYSK